MEELVQIVDFPMYSVSASGAVVNMKSGRNVSASPNKQGHLRVNLYDSVQGKQFTKSVSGLVARAFVSGHSDIFSTPQHLNGDLMDCRAENLVWRPRWHAYNYHRQFTHDYDVTFGRYGSIGPVLELTTQTMYQTLEEGVVDTGVLILNVMRCIYYEEPKQVWPLKYVFQLIR